MFEDQQNIELFTEFGWIRLDRQDKTSVAISVLDYEYRYLKTRPRAPPSWIAHRQRTPVWIRCQ
jgi:hypothetical protein